MEVGKTYKSKGSGYFEVIEGLKKSRLKIRFVETGHEVVVTKGNAVKGAVRDVMRKHYFGVGFVGTGVSRVKDVRSFAVWVGMLERCYSTEYLNGGAYQGCYVADEWHCFKIFQEWYEAQPYCDIYEIDKDLLVKGNRLYSPQTCVLLPKHLNIALQGKRKNMGAYPCGVYYKKKNKNFIAQLAYGDGVQRHLGSFSTWQEAADAYNNAKTDQIRNLAETHKDVLDPRAHSAMSSWSAV